ncbi:methyltransferase type 12 [candidate division WOR_3 bacterium SM23_42]|uniref:Methyltransferase type 12 n=1 Tax=candidate division WOR_3 bacterium SM23_42 TaxID=1703779 RepID=A0A0S8FQ49_UNCW3|nr:MAG: methyltransferase type 12 [candidate division WOR_3 bacterium SM23_42]
MDSSSFEKYFQTNKALWNRLTALHRESEFYDLNGFKKGKSSLNFIELDELGDVRGKTILHLQCHFGMDTLSWVRLGAQVTGIDFSEEAIQLAKSLTKELSINALFVHSNIYDLPKVLNKQFDIVYTSYGVLCWLPDLKEWGRIIHHFLKKDGTFYMIEFHPIRAMFDDDGNMKEPYFHGEEPVKYEGSGTYAEPSADFHHVSYEWLHSLSDVINALIGASLKIESIHEFPFSVYGDLPFLVKGEDGLWRHKNKDIRIPLMFSIKAKKSGSTAPNK